ncbi:transporter substrate-binding domain-containing protein [Vibrio quintilis]|nr:transporter substrate-binding domain-containing protein [Vibrio quintilis]
MIKNRSMLTGKPIVALLALTLLGLHCPAQADLLKNILSDGVLKVGTTGDYKPFTYLNQDHYTGYDIDVANHIARQMGVKVEFVKTTWKHLTTGLQAGEYDIAMGGITKRMNRQLVAEISHGYMTFGKCFLVATGLENKFDTLEKVNKPDVRVGVNIGGTNEKFARQYLPNAQIIRFDNNLDVPVAVAEGKIDVMITETPEALYYQHKDKRLDAVREHDPFTKSQFGYLIPAGEQRLLNAINYAMEDMQLKGTDIQLMKKNGLM